MESVLVAPFRSSIQQKTLFNIHLISLFNYPIINTKTKVLVGERNPSGLGPSIGFGNDSRNPLWQNGTAFGTHTKEIILSLSGQKLWSAINQQLGTTLKARAIEKSPAYANFCLQLLLITTSLLLLLFKRIKGFVWCHLVEEEGRHLNLLMFIERNFTRKIFG